MLGIIRFIFLPPSSQSLPSIQNVKKLLTILLKDETILKRKWDLKKRITGHEIEARLFI